jgi:hypothetical protein
MNIDPSLLEDEPIEVDERAKTLRYLPPVFCEIRVPPFPADRPLPERKPVPCVETRALRSPR